MLSVPPTSLFSNYWVEVSGGTNPDFQRVGIRASSEKVSLLINCLERFAKVVGVPC
jgi:hypothetical protein